MIVVDASAAVAILQREDGFEALSEKLLADGSRCISPVSAVEVAMALSRKFTDPTNVVDAYFRLSAIDIHPTDAAQAELARAAYLTFGKGRHPARLNLGDCFSYAVAKSLNAPLLYVGGDFARTDVRSA